MSANLASLCESCFSNITAVSKSSEVAFQRGGSPPSASSREGKIYSVLAHRLQTNGYNDRMCLKSAFATILGQITSLPCARNSDYAPAAQSKDP